MDFDPRDYDSRDDQRHGNTPNRGNRGDSNDYDRDDDWSQPHIRSRDRDDDARTLGRGPGSDSRASHSDEYTRDRHSDARWLERDRDHREREVDPRDAFTRDLRLPRGMDRELVRDRKREYTLRGSESRTLATVGAFRVVSSRDLRDHHGRPADLRSGDLRHLREQGLIETVRVPGSREHAVALTKEGRSLLEHHRDRDEGHRQTFWDGIKRERELEHDVQVYRAYEREAERLHERGARVDRVLLDYELKRDYQKWLHERDRNRDDYDGHPDRTAEEIRDWALEYDLPYFDDEVHFPDLRIEYQEPDGRWDHDDIEVTTEHYRGAHAASVARSGFSCYGGSSLRIGGRSGGGRGGGGRHGGLAGEFWR
jgi:DNA-binding MarR family transcriptional regulator